MCGGGGKCDGDVPWPSSLKVSSRFSLSFSFFPRRRFLPPWLWLSACAQEAVAVAQSAARCVEEGMTYLSLVLGHIDGFSCVSVV